jgi:hypothetical protein
MKEQVSWTDSGKLARLAIVELCGWRNAKGNATPVGRRIAEQSWAELSSAAKRVLERRGIAE